MHTKKILRKEEKIIFPINVTRLEQADYEYLLKQAENRPDSYKSSYISFLKDFMNNHKPELKED